MAEALELRPMCSNKPMTGWVKARKRTVTAQIGCFHESDIVPIYST